MEDGSGGVGACAVVDGAEPGAASGEDCAVLDGGVTGEVTAGVCAALVDGDGDEIAGQGDPLALRTWPAPQSAAGPEGAGAGVEIEGVAGAAGAAAFGTLCANAGALTKIAAQAAAVKSCFIGHDLRGFANRWGARPGCGQNVIPTGLVPGFLTPFSDAAGVRPQNKVDVTLSGPRPVVAGS